MFVGAHVADLARQAGADVFGDHGDVAALAAGFGNAFEDGRQVADGNPFRQQVLQHPLDAAQRNLVGNHIPDQFLMLLVQLVQKFLGLRVRQQFGHVVLDHLGQVGGDDGGHLDHGVAAEQGLLAVRFVEP